MSDVICQVTDCNKAEYPGFGYCTPHYKAALQQAQDAGETCTADGCSAPLVTLQFCKDHYLENQRDNPMSGKTARRCKEKRCKQWVYARDLCRAHYMAARLERNPVCSEDGCDRKVAVLKSGLCMAHYQRARREALHVMQLVGGE